MNQAIADLIAKVCEMEDGTIHPGLFFWLKEQVEKDPDTEILPLVTFLRAKGATPAQIYQTTRRPRKE